MTNLDEVVRYIDVSFPDRVEDPRQRKNWHQCHAMVRGYVSKFFDAAGRPTGDWKIVGAEREFQRFITNPDTGAKSRTFFARGKTDLIVQIETASQQDDTGTSGEHWLVEHKTASRIDADYIERLPKDFQIIFYADAVAEELGVPIVGIVYNAAVKKKLKQGEGETEIEFEGREREAIEKYRVGIKRRPTESDDEYGVRVAERVAKFPELKSYPQRKFPEGDTAFAERLLEYYVGDGSIDMYLRERLYLSPDQIVACQRQVWQITQWLLMARRLNFWLENDDFCFNWNRPCKFWPICRSGDNPLTIENLYTEKPNRHNELEESPRPEFDGLESLTVSAMRAFRNCPKMYYLEYVMRLEPLGEDAEALYLGHVYHGALERLYAPWVHKEEIKNEGEPE